MLDAMIDAIKESMIDSYCIVLPETIKPFDYSVFEFPFPGTVWGAFEFPTSFSGRFISGF